MCDGEGGVYLVSLVCGVVVLCSVLYCESCVVVSIVAASYTIMQTSPPQPPPHTHTRSRGPSPIAPTLDALPPILVEDQQDVILPLLHPADLTPDHPNLTTTLETLAAALPTVTPTMHTLPMVLQPSALLQAVGKVGLAQIPHTLVPSNDGGKGGSGDDMAEVVQTQVLDLLGEEGHATYTRMVVCQDDLRVHGMRWGLWVGAVGGWRMWVGGGCGWVWMWVDSVYSGLCMCVYACMHTTNHTHTHGTTIHTYTHTHTPQVLVLHCCDVVSK